MRSGDVIAGRYRLEDVAGTGGMGEVWRATDLELRRVVAVKQASTGDHEGIRREARIGAGLQHPNVVVEDDVRADGPLSPRAAAHVGRQIAAALSAMHATGTVHRDVTSTGSERNAGTPGYMAPEVLNGHPWSCSRTITAPPTPNASSG